MSAPGEFTFGVSRKRSPGDYGSTSQDALLRAQFRRLADVEAMDVYDEMLAAATARRLAENTAPKLGNGRPDPAADGRTCGLISTYNAGCKCAECKRASADYRRRLRQKATPA